MQRTCPRAASATILSRFIVLNGSGNAMSPPPGLRHRVPAIYYNRFFAKSGGLISYGIDFAESYRQAAGYIDRVLKGANPGDLPVQQPTKYELIVNMKTATAMDLEVPAHLQQAADEVVE